MKNNNNNKRIVCVLAMLSHLQFIPQYTEADFLSMPLKT